MTLVAQVPVGSEHVQQDPIMASVAPVLVHSNVRMHDKLCIGTADGIASGAMQTCLGDATW